MNIIFLENPKTGTTTLTRALKVKFIIKSLLRFNRPLLATGFWQIFPMQKRIKKILSLPASTQKKIKFIFADTYHFGLHEELTQSFKYISIVREPLSRIYSEINYEYLMEVNVKYNTNVSDFIRNDIRFDNLQTRIFSGATHKNYGECGKDELVKAKKNIEDHFLWVGVTEMFDESMLTLNSFLGSTYYARANSNPYKLKNLNADDIKYLKEINKFDIELYDFVINRLKNHTVITGKQFKTTLESYKKTNHLVQLFIAAPLSKLASLSHYLFYPKGTVTLRKAIHKKNI